MSNLFLDTFFCFFLNFLLIITFELGLFGLNFMCGQISLTFQATKALVPCGILPAVLLYSVLQIVSQILFRLSRQKFWNILCRISGKSYLGKPLYLKTVYNSHKILFHLNLLIFNLVKY